MLDIVDNTKIQTTFTAIRDTSIYERYTLNSYQFSAAKSASEAKMLQAAVFDEKKAVKSFSQFKKDAQEICDIQQKTWLRVEREMCVRQAVQSEVFRSMQEDADLYPYWIYKGAMDSRERPEHVAMEGKVFKIGSPSGDACFPPNDWNCRCSGEAIDDNEKGNKKALSNQEAKEILDRDVDEQFRYNPANEGMMPKTGSYFQALPNANQGNKNIFGLKNIEADNHLTGLNSIIKAATGLHYLVETVNEWKNDYHTNKGDVIFQNKASFTNVKFTGKSLHAIQQHSRGFENIPATIEKPNEIWMSWKNVADQRQVLRNYINFGKTCYIVQTVDGIVSDAFAVSKIGANNYRKGLIF